MVVDYKIVKQDNYQKFHFIILSLVKIIRLMDYYDYSKLYKLSKNKILQKLSISLN